MFTSLSKLKSEKKKEIRQVHLLRFLSSPKLSLFCCRYFRPLSVRFFFIILPHYTVKTTDTRRITPYPLAARNSMWRHIAPDWSSINSLERWHHETDWKPTRNHGIPNGILVQWWWGFWGAQEPKRSLVFSSALLTTKLITQQPSIMIRQKKIHTNNQLPLPLLLHPIVLYFFVYKKAKLILIFNIVGWKKREEEETCKWAKN